MYNHLKGQLFSKSPGAAVIEAGGVGYALRVSLATYERLPAAGAECRLLTRLMVREDAHELIGFADEAERRVFDALVSVSGVGANLALAVLSTLSPRELAEAVRTDNHAVLRRVKGLGQKKSELIVLELRGRIEELCREAGPAAAAGAGMPSGPAEDAVGALVALGYSRNEAQDAVGRARRELGGSPAVEDLIRVALRSAK
ncbi:MAG TPA: Holliday junction branch migration protein RuvA [Planctomycetota bacterium]|nr:Holliday junction branch migration protein RuvA [Planctomycetota bacterium]